MSKLKNAVSKIGLPDVLYSVGIALVGVGLWWVRPWLALVGVGCVLLVSGIIGSR